MTHPSEEILEFWLTECGPEAWYAGGDDLDQTIRDRFLSTWEEAKSGAFKDWTSDPRKCLALIILLDQFARNMFRGDAQAFSTDSAAKAAACKALKQGWDLRFNEPERQFFYMPFMHSELSTDQDHSVRLMCQKMPEGREAHLLHARAHREVIRRFGRFPYRNEALGRRSRTDEIAFMEEGGYGAIVKELGAENKV